MKEKICKNCGTVCPDEFAFCPFCGTDLKEPKCPSCGGDILEGAKYCIYCGAKLDKADAPILDTSAENEDEEVVEEASEEVFDSDDEESVVAEVAPKRSKVKKESTPKKKHAVRVIKNAVVLSLCIILFALSFCGVVGTEIGDVFLQDEVDMDRIEISAVDIIGIMGATAQSDPDSYVDEFDELEERLEESLKKDYNDRLGKVIVSDKSLKILEKCVVAYLKVAVSSDDISPDMAGYFNTVKNSAFYNNIIIAGVFCLLNIFFTFAMMVVSAISFFSVLFNKKNRVSKVLYALPAYLFISLLILFVLKTTFGVGTVVASAMGATLFFEIVALLTSVLYVVLANKSKSIKTAIPKFVSLGVMTIVCACMFAPVFTAKYDVVLANKRTSNTYSVGVDAGGLLTYLPPEWTEELENNSSDTHDSLMQTVEHMIDSVSDMTSYEFKDQGGELITRTIMTYLTIAIGNYNLTGALSAGYYILLFVFMLLGASAVTSVATLYKDNKNARVFTVIALVCIILALACSIGWICVLNYELDDLALNFTVGGGLIAGIIVITAGMIATSVLKSALNRPAKPREKKPSVEYVDDEE